MDDELLTRGEAMKFLRVSNSTLWRLTKAGELTVIKRGAYVRYHRSDLIAWLERHTIKGEL